MDLLTPTAGLSLQSVALRLTAAMALGGIIGMERETKGRPAGFRTYMLVSLGATAAMLLNLYMACVGVQQQAIASMDVARIGAQVINGVGFLGAGTILLTPRHEIKGITTAAGLWAAACLGLAIGAGFWECVVIGVFFVLICMSLFSRVERLVMSFAKNMNVYIEFDKAENISSISAGICGMKTKIFNVDIGRLAGNNGLSAVYSIYLPSRANHTDILAKLSAIEGIRLIVEV